MDKNASLLRNRSVKVYIVIKHCIIVVYILVFKILQITILMYALSNSGFPLFSAESLLAIMFTSLFIRNSKNLTRHFLPESILMINALIDFVKFTSQIA